MLREAQSLHCSQCTKSLGNHAQHMESQKETRSTPSGHSQPGVFDCKIRMQCIGQSAKRTMHEKRYEKQVFQGPANIYSYPLCCKQQRPCPVNITESPIHLMGAIRLSLGKYNKKYLIFPDKCDDSKVCTMCNMRRSLI